MSLATRDGPAPRDETVQDARRPLARRSVSPAWTQSPFRRVGRAQGEALSRFFPFGAYCRRMPTPYGSRGGMAFGADELRVLRRALAVALHPAPLPDEDIRACMRLAETVDEAVREAGRLRAFLLADLARYRQALPGSVTGYLELLQDAVATGYVPRPDDLAALRALRGNPVAAALLDRCGALGPVRSVRARRSAALPSAALPAVALTPAPRTRLLAIPGGRAADDPKRPEKPQNPEKPHEPRKPQEEPAPPRRPATDRPMPKPSEVFPPRRRPTPPPPPEHLAVG